MDTETIQSLVSILVWGALFLLMMRFGGGVHIMGGHGHHGGHGDGKGAGAGAPTKDLVCGMGVDPAKAAAASGHAGCTYYFCSTSCRDKFEKDPQRYAVAAVEGQITAQSFLLGLLEVFAYGVYFGLVFAPLYNFFAMASERRNADRSMT